MRRDAKFFFFHSERCRRVSVDVDGHHLRDDPLKVLRAYFGLKALLPDAQVTAESTRHGFHVKAVGDCIRKIPMEQRVSLREALGDDPDRIEYERFKLKHNMQWYIETLFTVKFHPDKSSFVEEIDPVALPSASRIPAKKLCR